MKNLAGKWAVMPNSISPGDLVARVWIPAFNGSFGIVISNVHVSGGFNGHPAELWIIHVLVFGGRVIEFRSRYDSTYELLEKAP